MRYFTTSSRIAARAEEYSSSYRPKGYGMSNALQRARKPFAVRNAVTGLMLVAFCVGVYSYSIMAVKQDDFSDVELPEEVKARDSTPGVSES